MLNKLKKYKLYIIPSVIVLIIVLIKIFYKKKNYHILKKNAKIYERIEKDNIKSRQSIHNYSVCFWIYINDWTYMSDSEKHILTHGSLNLKYNDCYPGIYLTKNINNMQIYLSTTHGLETYTIKDIPIKKWCHVYIYVDKDSINIYINGELDTIHTLKGYSILHNKDLHINA